MKENSKTISKNKINRMLKNSYVKDFLISSVHHKITNQKFWIRDTLQLTLNNPNRVIIKRKTKRKRKKMKIRTKINIQCKNNKK